MDPIVGKLSKCTIDGKDYLVDTSKLSWPTMIEPIPMTVPWDWEAGFKAIQTSFFDQIVQSFCVPPALLYNPAGFSTTQAPSYPSFARMYNVLDIERNLPEWITESRADVACGLDEAEREFERRLANTAWGKWAARAG